MAYSWSFDANGLDQWLSQWTVGHVEIAVRSTLNISQRIHRIEDLINVD